MRVICLTILVCLPGYALIQVDPLGNVPSHFSAALPQLSRVESESGIHLCNWNKILRLFYTRRARFLFQYIYIYKYDWKDVKNCTVLQLGVGLKIFSVVPDSLFPCPVHYKALSYHVNQHASKNTTLQQVLLIITFCKPTRGELGFPEPSISVWMLNHIPAVVVAIMKGRYLLRVEGSNIQAVWSEYIRRNSSLISCFCIFICIFPWDHSRWEKWAVTEFPSVVVPLETWEYLPWWCICCKQ